MNVVVNATALDKSGALTILTQFIEHAGKCTRYHFYCFVPQSLALHKPENVTFIELPKKGWLGRIVWDSYGLKRYLKKIKISAVKVISLQNTSMNVNTEQIIYLHQSLPFYESKWSVFNKEQFKFFLYKHFYKFFVLLYVRETTFFVVQTNWMKAALCSQWNISLDKVHVIRPDIKLPDSDINVVEANGIKSTHNLIYPATPFLYKNHEVILEALMILKANNVSVSRKINFQVTFRPEQYPSFAEKVVDMGLVDNVEYLGEMPYSELVKRYLASSIVLFPSYVETFGLPLAEGAVFRKPILCSDLSYAREVLNDYPGAFYLDHRSPRAWSKAIENTLADVDNNSLNCDGYTFEQSPSWPDFFELLSRDNYV